MRRALTWSLAALLGCGGASGAADHAAHGGGPVAVDAVSRIDGVAISAAEVERLARAGGMSASAALARLEAQQLLAAEAARRGYDKQAETVRVDKQALVQSLLERDIESEQVDETEVSAAYVRSRARFETPEKRKATHVLAYLPKHADDAALAAGRAFAENAIRQLMAADDLDAVLSQLKASKSPLFAVKVERLPAVAHDGSFAPEFESALFALPRPGVVPIPVKTEFGWHAIVVTEIDPATKVPVLLARDTLRRELAIARHKLALEALLSKLRDARAVHYAERVEQALASLDL